jgi:FKBP-type peptidyl-prolyl cis-trans isomerase
MKLQQTLGSASIAYKESNFDGTLSKLEQLQKTIAEWRIAVVAKQAAGAVPVEPEKEPEPPAESVEFSMNQTHVPDKCKRQAEEGATMRVHYVGKLLTGTKKMFASSFHTGSTPFKFKLGSSDVIDAWNRGLLGMCEGERRRLLVPWHMGYGKAGTKGVPPYSDLQYDLELIELSNPKLPPPSKKGKKAPSHLPGKKEL